MARITTELGRQKVLAPNLFFDVEDGGTELHATLNTMFQVFSDNITQKWFGNITLGKNGDIDDAITLTHNFGTASSNLKCLFIVSDSLLTKAQVDVQFSVVQNNTNSVIVTNLDTINTITFSVYIAATKLKVEIGDLDPEVVSYFESKAKAFALVLG